MRRFYSKCIDNVLGLEMIYSDCSYNMACIQLEYEGIEIITVTNKEINGKNYYYITAKMNTVINKTNVYFVYDEYRGILMMDEKEKYKNYKNV